MLSGLTMHHPKSVPKKKKNKKHKNLKKSYN